MRNDATLPFRQAGHLNILPGKCSKNGYNPKKFHGKRGLNGNVYGQHKKLSTRSPHTRTHAQQNHAKFEGNCILPQRNLSYPNISNANNLHL